MSHRLVTEAEVRALPVGALLRLAPGTLLTPSARDLAALRRVSIQFDSGGPGVQSLQDGDRVGLADGDWLLEVRGGRARLRRIE